MILSVGGAFIRVWRPRTGLAAEVPTTVVMSGEDVVAVGEEAAAMEGKLPKDQDFVRPFFSDRIVVRDALRVLIERALIKAQETGSLLDRMRVQLAVPVSTPTLHREWLIRTVRESGVGFVQVVDPLVAVARKQGKRRGEIPVVGVLDCGFSAVRAVIYVGGKPLVSEMTPHLGVHSICQSIVQAEQITNRHIFPQSALYPLQLGLVQTGYDEKTKKSFSGALDKTIIKNLQRDYVLGVHGLFHALQERLSAEQLSFFRQNGWFVVGGGVGLLDDDIDWEKELGIPVRKVPGPTYANLQSLK